MADKAKSEGQNGEENDGKLLSRFLGLIAALVSIAAIWVSWNEHQLAKFHHDADTELQLKLALADFVTENKAEIFSGTPAQKENMINVMLGTFPPDQTVALFQRLASTTDAGDRAIWQQAWREARSLLEKVTPQTVGDLDFNLVGCASQGGSVRCSFAVTNTGGAGRRFCVLSASRIINDRGGEHPLGGPTDCFSNISVDGNSQVFFPLEFKGVKDVGPRLRRVEVRVGKSVATWRNVFVSHQAIPLAQLSLASGSSASIPGTPLVLTLKRVERAAEPDRYQVDFSLILPGRPEKEAERVGQGSSYTYEGYRIRVLSATQDGATFSVEQAF